jgi:ribose transport system substrate-binding protein
MVLGAIAAAEAAGRKGIVFVGFDAIDDAVKAVGEGKLKATVAQQPREMGLLGVEYAVKFLNGEDVPDFVPVPLKLVTK